MNKEWQSVLKKSFVNGEVADSSKNETADLELKNIGLDYSKPEKNKTLLGWSFSLTVCGTGRGNWVRPCPILQTLVGGDTCHKMTGITFECDNCRVDVQWQLGLVGAKVYWWQLWTLCKKKYVKVMIWIIKCNTWS